MIPQRKNGRRGEGLAGPRATAHAATRIWMSVDLVALALALDGARPLPAGSARLVPWGGDVSAPRRVPASAFVNVRRRVLGETTARPVEPQREAPSTEAAAASVHPLHRTRPAVAPVTTSQMPRRHKLMLAAAAVVMSLGFIGAGAQRLGQPANAAAAASLAG